MRKLLLFIIISVLIFPACKKGSDSKPKKDYLTEGNWMLTSGLYTVTVGGFPLLNGNMLDTMSDCRKDNLQIFKTDMTLWTDEGATKCNSTDPQQTQSGEWALSENDTKLSGTFFSMSQTADIIQLDATTLKLSTTMTGTEPASGMPYSAKVDLSFKNVK